MEKIEQYRIFSLTLPGRQVEGRFSLGEECAVVRGFASGNDLVTVRFAPKETGTWSFQIRSDASEVSGSFQCIPAEEGNHGPVSVRGRGFSYADGKAFLPFGTTCYGWVHQPQTLREQTLQSLKESPFNKVRMCLFPKYMVYNTSEPERFPFCKDSNGNWDVNNPDLGFWENFETQLQALDRLGIEADLILFHPYDRWGFATLSREESLTYLDYCVSRLSAYKNVWWSLANEYDLLPGKTEADWDAFAERITKLDVVGHPLSIHNCCQLYPNRDWMTHCSIQSNLCRQTLTWGWAYQKPVVIDECGYEGNIEFNWGNLSAFELVNRFWTTVCCGGWCTHGETFYREDEVLWWGKGGTLQGKSHVRIAFLRKILESLGESPTPVMVALPTNPNSAEQTEANPFGAAMQRMPEAARTAFIAELIPMVCGGTGYRLIYLGRTCPAWLDVEPPGEGLWHVDVIDIWEMTRRHTDDITEKSRISLPGREGMAVLLYR